VTADNFACDPDEITVTRGENVAIVLRSLDALHDFTIKELDAHGSLTTARRQPGYFAPTGPAGTRSTAQCRATGRQAPSSCETAIER
jgi:hypothetical protein